MFSQFSFYSSADAMAPVLDGSSGSLVNLLDEVLVTGYGTKSPLGWIRFDTGSFRGAWQQPSGSGCVLFVNDAAVSSGVNGYTKEAHVCGYETIYNLTSSGGSGDLGTGQGQFLLPLQGYLGTATLTNKTYNSGSFIWRKSASIDSVPRNWILYGDAYTFYMFIDPGDSATTLYSMYIFGDMYSFKPTTDRYKCYIQGRCATSATVTTVYDATDVITIPTSTFWANMYAARGFGGGGRSTLLTKLGDPGKGANQITTYPANGGNFGTGGPMSGTIPMANAVDNAIYISPIWIAETGNGCIRGRARGFYHLCHPVTSVSDGQTFSGTNEYSGRQFTVVKPGPGNGIMIIETSPTVETNDV